MQRSILAGAHSSRKTHCLGVAVRVEESRLHAVMNGMCACVHAYVRMCGMAVSMDLVCRWRRAGCARGKGMGGDGAENTVRGPELQVERSRATHAGMKDTLYGEQRCLQT